MVRRKKGKKGKIDPNDPRWAKYQFTPEEIEAREKRLKQIQYQKDKAMLESKQLSAWWLRRCDRYPTKLIVKFLAKVKVEDTDGVDSEFNQVNTIIYSFMCQEQPLNLLEYGTLTVSNGEDNKVKALIREQVEAQLPWLIPSVREVEGYLSALKKLGSGCEESDKALLNTHIEQVIQPLPKEVEIRFLGPDIPNDLLLEAVRLTGNQKLIPFSKPVQALNFSSEEMNEFTLQSKGRQSRYYRRGTFDTRLVATVTIGFPFGKFTDLEYHSLLNLAMGLEFHPELDPNCPSVSAIRQQQLFWELTAKEIKERHPGLAWLNKEFWDFCTAVDEDYEVRKRSGTLSDDEKQDPECVKARYVSDFAHRRILELPAQMEVSFVSEMMSLVSKLEYAYYDELFEGDRVWWRNRKQVEHPGEHRKAGNTLLEDDLLEDDLAGEVTFGTYIGDAKYQDEPSKRRKPLPSYKRIAKVRLDNNTEATVPYSHLFVVCRS